MAELLEATRHMNTTRSCPQCGGLVTGHRAKKYCSQACKNRFNAFNGGPVCTKCGKRMYKTKDVAERPMCQPCRRGNAEHGALYSYDKGCRCQPCKDAKAASMREYVAMRTARDGISPTAKLKRERRGWVDDLAACAYCGDQMARMPSNGKKGYCKPCRSSLPRWIIDGLPGPRHRRALATIKKAARGRTGGKRVFIQGRCNWCGAVFMSAGGSFFCGAECRRLKARRDRGSLQFIISPVDRLAIYKRDKWTCQLCGRTVDRGARFPYPWSASLDHVIPQSAMLVPDHSPENLRLAHFLCNSFRRDGEVSVSEMRRLTNSRWSLAQSA